MKRPRALLGLLIAVCLASVAGCGSADGRFSGTWESTGGGQTRSLVSIWKEEGRYRFAVNRYDVSGAHLLRCSINGSCAYYEGEAPFYELRFSVRDDSDEQGLTIGCSGQPLPGKRATPIEWVERVTIEPDGETLRVQRIQLNGVDVEHAPRYFKKESGSPFR